MKLEEQVCSLEISKKLKELGVMQESLFYYDYAPHIGKKNKNLNEPILSFWGNVPWEDQFHNRIYDKESFISAFTVSELGEMLPSTYTMLKIDDTCKKIQYVSIIPSIMLSEVGETEAEARAKLLIKLLKFKNGQQIGNQNDNSQ
jgi:hypothetical protein